MKPLLLTISPRLYPTSPASSRSQRRVASNLSSPANRDIQSALCGRCRTTGALWFGASGRWPNCRTSKRASGSVLNRPLEQRRQPKGDDMFARHVSMYLKPHSATEFTRMIENEIIPLLRKQKGFKDEITFVVPDGTEAVAISLWDQKDTPKPTIAQPIHKCWKIGRASCRERKEISAVAGA